MGNQLIKNTHIDKDPIGNGGVGAQWKMYSGHRLDRDKRPVGIFMYDKKALAKMSTSIKEEYLQTLKKEPQTLARYKHPNILSILEPLIEDPKAMGYVTEQVIGSLYSMLAAQRTADIFPGELETKFHLLDLIEALQFLHNDVKTCHLSISPENIYITPDGKWKIAGLTFATQLVQNSTANSPVEFMTMGGDVKLTPNLKFTAPEVADSPSQCTFASDMFSLACLVYTIYKVGADKNCSNPYLINVNSVHDHREFVKRIDREDFSCIPSALRPTIIRMLNNDPNMRISINDFANNAFFKDPFIQTVKCLENLYQKDLPQQQTFLRGLARIILKFEPKFIKTKIIPLLNELMKNEQLASSILPIYFALMDSPDYLSKQDFTTLIWGAIKGLATGREIPAQALYLMIEHTEKLIEYVEIKEFQSTFVPLLGKSFECGVPKIQTIAIKRVEALYQKIEYNVLKSQILPRILILCTDPNIDVRKVAIILLSKIHTEIGRAHV